MLVGYQWLVSEALARQNAVAPGGYVETRDERIYLRPSGAYDTVEAIRETMLAVGGRSLRLGDVARVSRGLADPPQPRMRVAGRDAIGIGDNWNDAEMFEVCGLSIAMGNAAPSVQALADEVTTAIDDDGIWNAFERHGLI